MKKFLCLLLVCSIFVAFTSCKKNCTCKEKVTGISQEFPKDEMGGFTCKEIEQQLNLALKEEGGNVLGMKFTCR